MLQIRESPAQCASNDSAREGCQSLPITATIARISRSWQQVHMCRAPSGLHHPLLQRAGIGLPQWTSPPSSSLTASKTYATFPDGH
eukprot:SM007990S22512  [mRNA]  locus=s7990:167:421:+ [translate_table: standard]